MRLFGKIDFKGKTVILGEYLIYFFMFAKLPPPARIDSEIIVHHNILRGFLVFTIIKMTICVRKRTVLEKRQFP